MRTASPGQPAAAAALLPRGCEVIIQGGGANGTSESAAAEVAEALAGRQIKRLELSHSFGAGPRMARAVGAAGAEHLRLNQVGLTDETLPELAEAVAAGAASGALRRLALRQYGMDPARGKDPARLLATLGAALQRRGPGISLELEIEIYLEAEAAAVRATLAAMLGRVSLLSLRIYDRGGELELAVRSHVLRRLELRFQGDAARQRLPLRFIEAPALESVRLDHVYPSEAAPFLLDLASDPSLPALRVVELSFSKKNIRLQLRYMQLTPLANALRRALEQRAGGAAAGSAGAAALGEWRVEVDRDPSNEYTIRAWRP